MAVASRFDDVARSLMGIMPDQPRLATLLSLAADDPALQARLASVLDLDPGSTQTRALLSILADTTSLTDLSPAVSRMAPPARPSLDQRMASDPNILGTVMENIDQLPPEMANRVRGGDGVVEAYQMLADAGGDLAGRLGASAPPRQLNLPMGDDPGTAMIPFGVRGGGAPVGGPRGSGVTVPGPTGLSTQVTPRPALPGRGPRRLETTAGVPEGPVNPRQATAADATRRPTPRLESPDVVTERRAMEALEDAVNADRVRPRGPQESMLDRARQRASDVIRGSALPATAAVLGTAAYQLLQDGANRMPEAESAQDEYTPVPNITSQPQAYSAPRPMVPNVTRPPRAFSTADLAAETSPPPGVAVQDESITMDYSQMARDKIRQANEIQLREGRITPESAALTREADALYQRAADARREGFHPPIMPVEMQNQETSAIRARRAG